MVRALVEKGGIYANIWSRFNNHFRLGSYKQLPQSRLSEAVDYLMRLEVTPRALPGSPLPANQDKVPSGMKADRAVHDAALALGGQKHPHLSRADTPASRRTWPKVD